MELTFASQCGVACALLYAVWVDLRQHEIPNGCSVAILLIAGLQLAVNPAWLGLASMAVAVLLASCAAFTLYRFRVWGGGDVKLAIAMSAWVGLPGLDVLWTGFAAFGIPILLVAKIRRRDEVAFAPALAAGALMAQIWP